MKHFSILESFYERMGVFYGFEKALIDDFGIFADCNCDEVVTGIGGGGDYDCVSRPPFKDINVTTVKAVACRVTFFGHEFGSFPHARASAFSDRSPMVERSFWSYWQSQAEE